MIRTAILLILLLPSFGFSTSAAQPAIFERGTISIAEFKSEITEFLGSELAAHLKAIDSLNHPPDKIYGAGTTGEFSWGTFMRALAAYAELSGASKLAGRDLAREVAQIGLLEHRLGGTRFSQLYAILALRHYGRNLNSNRVWQSLNEQEKAAWRKLLDVSAFYDPKTQQVINLPENYLGVAARIASLSFQVGLLTDRALLDGVIMICRLRLAPGVVTPAHDHPHEQMTLVERGRVLFTIGDQQRIANSGDVLHFPSGDEELILIDIFSPIREDFLASSSFYGNGRE